MDYLFWFIVIIVVVILLRSIVQIDEYERGLLLQKIKDLEKELTITGDDEQILETKQIVINELIRIRQKKKLKKQTEKRSLKWQQ